MGVTQDPLKAGRSNDAWLVDLRGPQRDGALHDLREILLKGLRAAFSTRIQVDLESTLEDFTQEALMKVLANLDNFRGESRFSTWAQKIAVNVAYSELRRRSWQNVSLQEVTENDEGEELTPSFMTDPGVAPEEQIAQADMLRFVQELIDDQLTERQREAITAIIINEMPLSEVAQRMGTNRNALYKLIYDARQRLQKSLFEHDLTPQDVLAAFE